MPDIKAFMKSDFGALSAGNIIANIIGALFWLAIAIIIPVESYGRLNYLLAAGGVLSVLATLGLNVTLTTYTAKKIDIKNQAKLVVLIATAALAAALSFFSWSAALYLVGTSMFAMTSAELLGNRQYKKFAVYTVSSRALHIAASYGLYFVLGVDGVILGYAIGTIAFSLPSFSSLLKNAPSFAGLKNFLRFSVYAYALEVTKNIPFLMDKVLIASLSSLLILGYYQFGWQVLSFLMLIPVSLSQYLLPEEASGVNRTKIVQLVLLLSVSVAALSVFLAPIAISAYLPKFNDAILGVQIISTSIIPLAITAIFSARILAKEDSATVFLGSLIYAGVLPLTMSIPLMGYSVEQFSLAVLISACCQAVFLSVRSRKKYVRAT